jgi:hypothetical protein
VRGLPFQLAARLSALAARSRLRNGLMAHWFLTARSLMVWSAMAIMTLHKPLPPDNPMHTLVGRVAAEWSQVEHFLDIAIWRLAKVDDATGACMTGQILGSFAKMMAIKALCIHRKLDEKIFAQLKELSIKMKGSQDRRNRILHDAWYVMESDGSESETQQFKSMARDEWLFGFHDVDETYVNETLEKIGHHFTEASNLAGAIIDAMR